MYDIAKKARAGMKAKAQRLAGEKDHKTDSSDWTPAPELNADVKTGMRPVSRRAYKSGGKVAGSAAPTRADRKPRKAGGKVEAKGEQPLVDRYMNRDLKKANDYRDGKKHVGALKHGGRAKKEIGGAIDAIANGKVKGLIPTVMGMMGKDKDEKSSPLKHGGRAKKTDGGPMGSFKDVKTGKQITPEEVATSGFRDKSGNVPLPPRRPTNLTTAVPDKIKSDDGKMARKHGGRAKKQDGGGMDPRLGIVKPKALEFAQNLVTPGLKKGGRAKKEVGGPAIEAGKAAMSAMTPAPSVGPSPSASNVPPVGSGLLPQPKGNYEKPPAYDPEKYKDAGKLSGKKGISDFLSRAKDYGKMPGLKKGGRAAKADGGSLRSQFNEAFRNARASGAKTFEWNGKSYTTELAKPNKAPVGAMPGSSRAGAPPMGAGPGSRSANVAAPEGAGPGSKAPEQEGFFSRVFRRAQEVSGETPYRKKHITVEFGPTAAQKKNQADWDAPGARKKGGRVAKQIGGALGRSMPSMAPGAAMRPQVPQVGQGMMGRPSMPQLPPQAMANAQGRPFQPGGKFAPPPITTMPVNQLPSSSGLTQQGYASALSGTAPNQTPTQMLTPEQMAVANQTLSSVSGTSFPMATAPTSEQIAALGLPQMTYATGGRIARADGGPTKSKGKSQGKSNINIIISTGKADKPQQPDQPPMGAGMPPMPPPAPMMGAGAPPPMGGPGLPPMGPPPGPMGPPPGGMMPPMPRKAGGRVSKVARSYKDMMAGAASGEGRLQKTDIAKRGSKPAFEKGLNLSDAKNYPNKVPGATGGRTARKTGGKVYRSYKDMDAGAGSGKGRLEKTEIQSRKK